MQNYTAAYSSSSNEVESCVSDRYIYIPGTHMKNIRNVRKCKHDE